MSVYHIQPLDPQELASRFSTEDALNPLPTPDEEWKELHLDKIKSVLDRLPSREFDLIHLYFFMDKKQTDIAEIFNITQAAVSYRIKRALTRIRFLVEIPEVSKDDVYDDLLPVMPSQLDARIFSEMFESTCQSEVAEILKITQGRVRHRFIANLERLGEALLERTEAFLTRTKPGPDVDVVRKAVASIRTDKPGLCTEEVELRLQGLADILLALPEDVRAEDLVLFGQYYKTFVKIRYNFNILREIKLPKWSKRSRKVIA